MNVRATAAAFFLLAVMISTPSGAAPNALTGKMSLYNCLLKGTWDCTAGGTAYTAEYEIAPGNTLHGHLYSAQGWEDTYFGYGDARFWWVGADSNGATESQTSADGLHYKAITFAGFSALLLAVRQAAGGRVSVLDRFLAKTILSHMFVLATGALLPVMLALYGLREHLVWLYSAALFGLAMLAFLVTYPHRRRKAVGQFPPPSIFAVLVVLGALAIIVMLVGIAGNFGADPAFYVTALLANFMTMAFAFLTAFDVIVHQAEGS